MKLWTALAAASGALLAQTPEVTLRLSTAGGQTTFRLGESISIELNFTSTVPRRHSAIGGGTDRMGLEALNETFEEARRRLQLPPGTQLHWAIGGWTNRVLEEWVGR